MDYIYKPVDFAAHREPVTDLHRRALSQIYCALFLLAVGAFVGAHIHIAYGCGGLNSAMTICLAISLLQVTYQRWIWARVVCLISTAVSFGATAGPLLSHFLEVDPQYIKDFFMANMLFFLSHTLSVRRGQRDVIHELTTLTAPLMITLWIASSKYIPEIHRVLGYVVFVLALLCIAIGGQRVPVLGISIRIHLEFVSLFSFCFQYSFLRLLLIYLVILFFLVHLRMHTIHSMALAAQVGGNDLIVTASITYFTKFFGRSVFVAVDIGTRVGVMVYQSIGNLLAFE